MEEYEVVGHIVKHVDGKTVYETIAISFPDPKLIKFMSPSEVTRGHLLNSDGSSVTVNKKTLKVVESRSSKDVTLSHKYDVKYTGGYSIDGKTIYLDEHFPSLLPVEGKQIDARLSIGMHHELPEKWMSDFEYEYPYAHEVATGIEKKYVESQGVTWKGYCDEVDKNLRNVYKHTLGKSPVALDLAPYLYCRDKEALKEIRESREE